MRLEKRVIFAAAMMIYISETGIFSNDLKYNAAMDNGAYNAGMTLYSDYFSMFVLNSYDSSSAENSFEYSFDSELIKAGRLELSGVWLEVTNPFGYSPVSDVYLEPAGAKCSFKTEKGGKYGFYMDLPLGMDFIVMKQYGAWAGAGKRFKLSGNMSAGVYAKISQKTMKAGEDDWILPDGYIPVSAPFYAGAEMDLETGVLYSGLLCFVSGSRYSLPGYFARFHGVLDTERITFSQLLVFSNGRYVPAENTAEVNRFKVSSKINWIPFPLFSFTSSAEYCQKYPGAFPAAYIEKELELSFSARISADLFSLSAAGRRGVMFDKNGLLEEPYKLEGRGKIVFKTVSAEIYAGEKGSAHRAESEWLGLDAWFSDNGILFSAGFEFEHNCADGNLFSGIISCRTEFEIPSGRIFAAGSMTAPLHAGKPADPLELTNLEIGWYSRFAF